MNERQRHQKILQLLAKQSIITVDELVEKLGASLATVRRDITALDSANLARKIRGGIETLNSADSPVSRLAGHSFSNSELQHAEEKRAIARAASELCQDGETIIINGGSTTYRMAEFLKEHRLHILTNSFLMADDLLRHSRNQIFLPGGEVYRTQNIVLSPYEQDTTINHFYASKLFMGAYAIRQQGLIEADPLLIKAEQKLIKQAEELIVLVDSSKFSAFGSLIFCPLEQIDILITDAGIQPKTQDMLENAGIKVLIAANDG